ncbi:MAG TPA: DegT/DnrJ/EryC1/StrS aminotransferase family protein [Candidatus Acidoferrum sp.]|jgi:dTDP-4-amino-4,6-dideoxygalactose transaminase
MSSTVTSFLPFHRALIEDEEKSAVLEVLESGWLTTGPRARQFESEFAKFVGANHALAVNSCTAALHLALAALDVGEGDEVIVPTMTFAASGEVVLYQRAKPVLVDCLPGSHHVDPLKIEDAITNRTKAILPVHFAGFPCDMDAILEIARKYNLKVVEDAAHSLPTFYKDRMVGALGDVTCFSFYATKTVTTGEGGMITTGDADLAERMRILSLHGISRDAWKRYTAQGTWRYEILEAGYKYNLTDMQAAIGSAQLAKCDSMRNARAKVADEYTRLLAGLEAFDTPVYSSESLHAWHLYVLQVNPRALSIGRDQVIEELKARGIGTSVHFIPLHLHPLYQNTLGYRPGQFPNAETRFEHSLSLPIYPSLTADEVERVASALHDIARQFRS